MRIVLWGKIVFTLVLWVVPLFLPTGVYDAIKFPVPEPIMYLRLLAVTYLALAVGYTGGLMRLNMGEDITGVVVMGIVSNGLAAGILLYNGLRGTWAEWDTCPQLYMWVSAALTSIITIALVILSINK